MIISKVTKAGFHHLSRKYFWKNQRGSNWSLRPTSRLFRVNIKWTLCYKKTSIGETFNIFFINISPNFVSNTPNPKKSFNFYLKNMVVIRKKIEIMKLTGNLSSNVSSLGPFSIPVMFWKIMYILLKIFLFNKGFPQTLWKLLE